MSYLFICFAKKPGQLTKQALLRGPAFCSAFVNFPLLSLNGSFKTSSFSARVQLCFAIVNCRNIALREAPLFLVR